MRSSARYGAGAAPCSWPSSRARALRVTSATSERSASGRTLPAPSSIFSSRNARDSSRNSTGSKHGVGEALLERLRPGEHPVLAQRVLDDELDRLLGADEPGDELRAAPPGNEAEKDLRASEVPDRRGDRPVVAMERDLDSAPERRAVDRGEGDEGKLAQAAEELVPCLASLAGALGSDLSELVDVRADGEDEGLSGEQEPAPVSRSQVAEHLVERAQSLLAEGVRLLPVLAVVHRHERDRTDACVDALELEPGRRASHRSACSPRERPRPCLARCRGRSSRSERRAGRGNHGRAAPSAERRLRPADARRRSRRRRG